MYGKIFESIYDGTLAEDWRALITFQQFIILCNPDGMIDMTPQAISRRTGIPIEHIKAGINILEKPDKYSRTSDEDGRRIELIDSHRPWGWHIVNHEKYRNIKDLDTVRAQTRERVKKHREKNKLKENDALKCNGGSVTQSYSNESNAKKRYTDTDTDTDTTDQNLYVIESENLVIQELNAQTGKKFKPVPANLKFITARFNEGYTLEDLISVVTLKVREWKNNPDMFKYLRPATLFNATKFNQYIGEVGVLAPVATTKENGRKLSLGERATKAREECEQRYIDEHQTDLKLV